MNILEGFNLEINLLKFYTIWYEYDNKIKIFTWTAE